MKTILPTGRRSTNPATMDFGIPGGARDGEKASGRGMSCPSCGATGNRVIDSRDTNMGTAIRRRRVCLNCEFRFTTIELYRPDSGPFIPDYVI